MKKILITLLLLISTNSYCGELETRDSIKEDVFNLLVAEKFDDLDKLAENYRNNKSRTTSGIWKLTAFDTGVITFIDTFSNNRKETWDEAENRIMKWVEHSPNSPSAHIAYSTALLEHAWHFRRYTNAKKVPADAWPPFYEYVQRAETYLLKTKKIASKDPRWYQYMFHVAKFQGWPNNKFYELLNEATKNEPSYYETYFIAVDYLMPKWNGNIEEIEKFTNNVVQSTRKYEGNGMYARIYWYTSQSEFSDQIFDKSGAIWSKMKSGFEDVIKKYPDEWNLNNYAKFACLANDKEKTKEIMLRIKGNIVMDAWSSRNQLKHCMDL